jgi:cytidylate kinase
MKQNVVIAIDGPSSSGKSTLAKQMAKALNFHYVDSGAFYRATTWYFIQQGLDWNNASILGQALETIHLDFAFETETGQCLMLLNGKNVEPEIRSLAVSKSASEVSAIAGVRKFVTAQLRRMAENKNVVMDGRDIGTVVFPGADLKIYLVADPAKRSERRFLELKEKGNDVTESQIAQNLSGRDLLDTTRTAAPLKMAADARMLDNSFLNPEQQLELAKKWAEEKGIATGE